MAQGLKRSYDLQLKKAKFASVGRHAIDARYVDDKVKKQTLPEVLEWLWKDYQPANDGR